MSFAIQYHYLENQDEEKCKAILERAIDNVGQHMQASEIWTQFFDYETSLNHLGFANLIGFLAIKTPLIEQESVENK